MREILIITVKLLLSRNLFSFISLRLSMTSCNSSNWPIYRLVDIGANLTSKVFDQRELQQVINRSKQAGLVKIIVTGTTFENSKDAIRLCHLYPGFLYCTVGLHPHNASQMTAELLERLELLVKENSDVVVAVGECGLDFNRNFSSPQQQIDACESQIALACKLQKPLFLHEREAHKALTDILNRYKSIGLPPSVAHCFTGTVDEAINYVNMGLYIGLTGFLWKDKLENGVQQALRMNAIPLERLLIETDSPYMYPNTKYKKLAPNIKAKITADAQSFLDRYCSFQRNEPCSLAATVELIAAFADKTPEEVATNTTINAFKVFELEK